MNYALQLIEPKLSQTVSYLQTPEINWNIGLKVQKIKLKKVTGVKKFKNNL